MTMIVDDGRFEYYITTTAGRPSECYRRLKNSESLATPLDWNDVPFLVQQSVETKLNESTDGVPPGLYLR